MIDEISNQFKHCKSWEERYRLLIQYSRKLPKLSEEELEQIPEIHGCESRLWFEFSKDPRKIVAYSDARLMQGLLFILSEALFELSNEELEQFDILQLFDELQITRNLTNTRLNGLKQIGEIVREK
ncbi:hypothetical protein BMT54_00560 [Pasteurellaceae bacterium 15-036681]|nr:hypothetical protein BMT54_00560 [Pasteurellaceae bacterium 15-036681]